MKVIKHNKTKSIFILLLFTCLLFMVSFEPLNVRTTKNITRDHNDIYPKSSAITAIIYIEGNQGWKDFKIAGNCTGNGTLTDPYIISGLNIDGQGKSVYCIVIINSTVYFQIENCTLYDGSYGIYLNNVTNAILNNITCYNFINGISAFYISNSTFNNITSFGNDHDGIDILSADNLLLNKVNCSDNKYYGMLLNDFNNSMISNCTIKNNRFYGITFFGQDIKLYNNSVIDSPSGIRSRFCINLELIGNTMIRCGLELVTMDPTYYHIDPIYFDDLTCTNNTVNGKILYYYRNEINLDSNNFSNAGQVILYNCSNAVIKDLNLSQTTIGLHLISSHDNKIENINVNNDINGFCVEGSSENDFSYNIMNDNTVGIKIDSSNDNSFFYNNLTYNDFGISMKRCSDEKIIFNDIKNNTYGIYLESCFNCYISFNDIDNNIENGIKFRGGNDNEVYQNIISNNNIGIYLYYSLNYEISKNSFFGNNLDIFIIGEEEEWGNNLLYIIILILILIFIGVGGSIVAVSHAKFITGRDIQLKKKEKNEKLNQDENIINVPTSKAILDEMTNKELLIQIFDSEKNQEMNRSSKKIYLSSMSDDFLNKVDQLNLNLEQKKEFLKELFTFTPDERLEIVNDILEKLNFEL